MRLKQRSDIHRQHVQDIIGTHAPQREHRDHLIRAEGAEALGIQHGLLPQAQVGAGRLGRRVPYPRRVQLVPVLVLPP